MCEITYIAPLYLRSETAMDGEIWTPNLNEEKLRTLTQHLSFKVSPIQVFDYVYGVLYDPVYCKRYEQYLCRDYPRVPIINEPEDVRTLDSFYVSEDMFRAYSAAGARLRSLHLMADKNPAALSLDPSTAEDMEIGAVKYKDGVLHLNANKKILGIPKEVWEYQIGGYQVLDKWLKSHKGEELTLGSFTHIENIVGLLAETIRIQNELAKMHQSDAEFSPLNETN